jgi:hypothetical protein
VHQDGRPDFGHLGQLGAQGLGQIGHLLEAVGAVLMQPVHDLAGAEGLLADAFEESDESGQVEIEQIDAIQRSGRISGSRPG